MTFQFQKIVLIFLRITTFIVICPGFSFKGLSNIFKVGLSIGLSLMVNSMTPEIVITENMFLLFLFCLKESIFGLTLGFVTNLIFSTIEIAGHLVDFQVGFSMASVFDPSIGSNVSNYGRIYYWISICVFFLTDMHHRIISTLIKSFDYIPINSVNLNNLQTGAMIHIFLRVFELAINLAMPIIVVVLIADIVLGVISKTVPQINVLMLGMPIKAMISFFISMVTLNYLLKSIGNIMELLPKNLEGFMHLFK